MTRLYHLAQRVFNTPLAIHPQKSEVIIAALAERFGVAGVVRPQAFAEDWEEYSAADGEEDRGYDNVAGVAIVAVHGTLVHKNGYLRPASGMTGYDGIRQCFMAALEDPAVRALALDVDSPGGGGDGVGGGVGGFVQYGVNRLLAA